MKIVLYQPQQSNPLHGQPSSGDMLPLELMHVAAFPIRDGHLVTLIDGSFYDQEEAHRRVLEACADADLFATTGILGWMVSDAATAAERVRAAFPRVRRVVGGWFASVVPQLYLGDGLFEAVVLGQGECTFRDLVAAIQSGVSFEDVPGLALWRDGALLRTAHRAVVGFDRLSDPAWELIDFESYRLRQLRTGSAGHRARMPGPPWVGRQEPYVGISYFSSFGCPEPCAFCCSPNVTNRRWKAKPADKILDDLQMLQQRWGGFDVVRFHDANFGVMEKRTKEFAEGLLERGMRLGWNACMQTSSVNSYHESTLDRCAASGFYMAEMGAESGDAQTMQRIGKPILGDANLNAAARLHDRKIWASISYIIGFPYEPEESMLATIDEARRVQLRCPSASTQVLPFRPIPDTDMYEQSLELGFRPPEDLHGWGSIGEYHMHPTWNVMPARVMRARKLHNHYTTLFKERAQGRRRVFGRLAKWRLVLDEMRFPIDAKLFCALSRLEDRLRPKKHPRGWLDPPLA